MDSGSAAGYKSPARIAGVITEHWAGREMFCCACTSSHLTAAATNNRVWDYECPQCKRRYQLKASKHFQKNRVLDGDHQTMHDAVTLGEVLNLLLLHYAPGAWTVQNLLLVPSPFFTLAAIEKRKPLSPSARRSN